MQLKQLEKYNNTTFRLHRVNNCEKKKKNKGEALMINIIIQNVFNDVEYSDKLDCIHF